MSQRNQEYRYILHLPDYSYPADRINAANKTEARKLIAQAYRVDTPRSAASAGFVPFSKAKIEWLDEDKHHGRDTTGDLEHDTLAEWSQRGAAALLIAPETPLDPRIGQLCKEGSAVYYAYLNGDYEHGYVEGSLIDVTHQLKAADLQIRG